MPTTKHCLKLPIPEIKEAAELLNSAVTAHLTGNSELAEKLIQRADMPAIREWTESIWGMGGIYSQLKTKIGEPNTVSKDDRDPLRMPKKAGERALIERDGYKCRFCGIPVIRKEIRVMLNKIYPNALQWGSKNTEQHSAFQAMWVQYDHVIPHARGGKTTQENMVITCAPCNYGRMNFLLDEIDLEYPKSNTVKESDWDGLERLIQK